MASQSRWFRTKAWSQDKACLPSRSIPRCTHSDKLTCTTHSWSGGTCTHGINILNMLALHITHMYAHASPHTHHPHLHKWMPHIKPMLMHTCAATCNPHSYTCMPLHITHTSLTNMYMHGPHTSHIHTHMPSTCHLHSCTCKPPHVTHTDAHTFPPTLSTLMHAHAPHMSLTLMHTHVQHTTHTHEHACHIFIHKYTNSCTPTCAQSHILSHSHTHTHSQAHLTPMYSYHHSLKHSHSQHPLTTVVCLPSCTYAFTHSRAGAC